MTNETTLWTCRYQEYAPPNYRWWLNVYTDAPTFSHTPATGMRESEQPEWLRDIVRTAVVGGHMASGAPPNRGVSFVWFRVDKHGALHDFVDPFNVEPLNELRKPK
jgi:hypothetical protein